MIGIGKGDESLGKPELMGSACVGEIECGLLGKLILLGVEIILCKLYSSSGSGLGSGI